MSFKITAASKTDVGQQREQNEDNACAQLAKDGEAGLFIVADGMGGYQAGEEASRIAVDKIREVLQNLLLPISEQPTVKLTPIARWIPRNMPDRVQTAICLGEYSVPFSNHQVTTLTGQEAKQASPTSRGISLLDL